MTPVAPMIGINHLRFFIDFGADLSLQYIVQITKRLEKSINYGDPKPPRKPLFGAGWIELVRGIPGKRDGPSLVK